MRAFALRDYDWRFNIFIRFWLRSNKLEIKDKLVFICMVGILRVSSNEATPIWIKLKLYKAVKFSVWIKLEIDDLSGKVSIH
jgi:hypothetical protein